MALFEVIEVAVVGCAKTLPKSAKSSLGTSSLSVVEPNALAKSPNSFSSSRGLKSKSFWLSFLILVGDGEHVLNIFSMGFVMLLLLLGVQSAEKRSSSACVLRWVGELMPKSFLPKFVAAPMSIFFADFGRGALVMTGFFGFTVTLMVDCDFLSEFEYELVGDERSLSRYRLGEIERDREILLSFVSFIWEFNGVHTWL